MAARQSRASQKPRQGGDGSTEDGRGNGPVHEIKLADGSMIRLEIQAGNVLQGISAETARLFSSSLEGLGSALLRRRDIDPSEVNWRALSAITTKSADTVLRAAESSEEILTEISASRQNPVVRAATEVTALMAAAAHDRSRSVTELETETQAAVDAFEVVVRGSAEQVERLIEGLEPVAPSATEEVSDAEAEALARLRLQALYRTLIRDSYSVSDLAEWGLSRQRLKQLRNEKKLFAFDIPFRRGLHYPRWQFDPQTHRPRINMPTLLAASEDSGLDGIAFHRLMLNTEPGYGRTPVQLLDEGREDLVLNIIGAANAQGA